MQMTWALPLFLASLIWSSNAVKLRVAPVQSPPSTQPASIPAAPVKSTSQRPLAVAVQTMPVQASPDATPVHAQPAMPAAVKFLVAPPALSCSLLGGLITASVSPQCCFSVQVVTQRGLEAYGLAQPCKSFWECEADGTTPKPAFEAKAKAEMCEEAQCVESVNLAMEQNWMTRKSAGLLSRACNGTVSVAQDTAQAETMFSAERVASEHGSQRRNGSDEMTACFAGESIVHTRGRGQVPMATLEVAEEVLVEESVGVLVYQPVLSFLHRIRAEEAPFLTVKHERGVLRATAGHLVFVLEGLRRTDRPVGLLQPGDVLLAADSTGSDVMLTPSRVTAIHQSVTSIGLHAPLTASGTVIVDGVVASIYATPSLKVWLPHAAAHVVLLPVRLYHRLGLAHITASVWETAQRLGLSKANTCNQDAITEDEWHPYLDVCYRHLQLQRLLPASR